MVKVGLIGCGGIGAVHAKSWFELKDRAKLQAVADFDTKKATEVAEGKAKVYSDALKMLQEEELDGVDICLPTFLHAEYVILALKYVKNVLVEKPVCLNEQQAEQMFKAEKESGGTVHVAQVVRFDSPYQYLKKVVDSGEYGKVISANFHRISPKPVWIKDYDNPEKTGGMAIDMHIHDVDYIRYLMGASPDDVKASVAKDEKGIVHHIWGSYRYGNACLVAEASWNYPTSFVFSRCFRVMLEKATLVLDESDVLKVYPEDGEPFVPEVEEDINKDLGINISNFGMFLKEISAFLDYVEFGKGSGAAPLKDAVEALRIVKKELEQ